MKRSLLIGLVVVGLAILLTGKGICSQNMEHHDEKGHHDHEHGHDHGHGHHDAHHGGVLNVIGEEVGHIEVRITDDLLEAWFVGGGNDTDRAVPVEATEIPLKVRVHGGEDRDLTLMAAPMKLAGESEGNCSRFKATAEWLKDVHEFEAHGEIVFKGVAHELLIRYPHGYDPMHGKE